MRIRPLSDSDDDSLCTDSTCSSSSLDEEDYNVRMAPNWCAYRHMIERNGFRLDTCRDVKLWYQNYWETLVAQGESISKDYPGYRRACSADENELCKDVGLVRLAFDACVQAILMLIHSSQRTSSEEHIVHLERK